MATNTERIDELTQVTGILSTEQKLLAQSLQQAVEANRTLREEMTKLRDEVQKLRDEVQKLQTANGVLRVEVDDLKKSRDTWGQRVWQIVAGVLLAIAGGVVGYYLKR